MWGFGVWAAQSHQPRWHARWIILRSGLGVHSAMRGLGLFLGRSDRLLGARYRAGLGQKVFALFKARTATPRTTSSNTAYLKYCLCEASYRNRFPTSPQPRWKWPRPISFIACLERAPSTAFIHPQPIGIDLSSPAGSGTIQFAPQRSERPSNVI